MKRKNHIHAVLSDHEMARLERARKHEDRSRSDFIRLALLRQIAIIEGQMLAAGVIDPEAEALAAA